MHPRGRDGKWITKGGIVKIFKNDGSPNPLVGEVDGVAKNGAINVTLKDGSKVSAWPHQIEQSKGVARLDGGVPGAHPNLPEPHEVSHLLTGMRPATDEDRKRLTVPPAWTDVTVSNDPYALLQVKGKDAKGRVQSRYSDEHHAIQAEKKFARMKALHQKLPNLDAALERDTPKDGTASALLLMRRMGLRNGSENDTGADTFAYGASNLRAKHVLTDANGNVTLDFDAKDNVHQTLPVTDPDVKAMLLERVKGLGPDDPIFNTNESKTNAYLKAQVGSDFKVKDLRTYHANSLALGIISSMPKPTTLAEFKKARLEVARQVAAQLGNTPTVTLNSYLNPAIFDQWILDPSWTK